MKKEQIKQNFVEDKIRKFGVAAESLARSLISNSGIVMLNDEDFQTRLRGRPVPPNGRTYEDYRQRNRQPE